MDYSEKLDSKKQLIYQAIDTGIDFYSACVLAECEDTDISEMENDKEFTQLIRHKEKAFEQRLLKDIHGARRLELEKGQTATTRWLLEKINPDRWGNRSKVEIDRPEEKKKLSLEDIDQMTEEEATAALIETVNK
jgi:hypothetical protein